MKYHQLVPVRAVNALSDWLVFNLEELGVDTPLVYSRLLLSLLHNTINITTIEQAADIPYFKEFISLHSKQYNINNHYNTNQLLANLDIEELKKFAAVNLLIDATGSNSTGQETVAGHTNNQNQHNSTINSLVNELHKKIRAIEKENSSSSSSTPTSSHAFIDQVTELNKGKNLNSLDQVENLRNRFNDMKESLETCTIEDVTKKYYSAFPALDKELNPCTNSNLNHHFTKNNSNIRRSRTAVSSPESSNKNLSWSNVFNNKNLVVMNQIPSKMNVSASNSANHKTSNTSNGLNSLKRKSKRKRAGKTKSFYINRKPFTASDDGASLWDMNFEGNWEMGQDLISDFVMNQQNYDQKSAHHIMRNRSISEGDFRGNYKKHGNRNHHKINNNNDEDVQDLYLKKEINSHTKEDASFHLPIQLLPATENSQGVNIQFNANVVNVHKNNTKQDPGQQQDYIAQLKTKFDKIKSIWNDVQTSSDGYDTVDGVASVRNVWEPLNEIVPQCYEQNCGTWASNPAQNTNYNGFGMQNQQQFNADYNFIKCGTNLQTSIWSNEGNGEEMHEIKDTLQCREIFDQASDTDSCYFSSLNTTLNAMPIGEKRGSHISLSNHSEHSMFTEVVSSKKGSNNNLLNHLAITGNNMDNNKNEIDQEIAKNCDEDENLLTSEKTHFKPIAYPDGYTFEISNNLDDVEFYRSESGSLYLDQDQYMEFRMDHLRDEFYMNYNTNFDNDESMQEITDPTPLKFIVKFCVRRNEKCCQTDEQDFEEFDNVSVSSNSFGFNSHYDHFQTNWRYSEKILGDTRIDFNDDSESPMSSKCIWSNAEGLNNQSESHRLWETCNTCQDSISFPANRRLKDELLADGEEILSDLNYFQSLIIGSDWHDETAPNEIVTKDDPADNLIDRTRVYQKVDKFVNDLLKPETTKTLAKALDNCSTDWENVADNDLLPFAYLFNCQVNNNQNNCKDRGRTQANQSNMSDDEKAQMKQDLKLFEIQKTPPDKNVDQPVTDSTVNFHNIRNYIDAELWKSTDQKIPLTLLQFQSTMIKNARLERKRRHSACKNLSNNYYQIKFTGYDYLDVFDTGNEKINKCINYGERLIMINDTLDHALNIGDFNETSGKEATYVDGYNFITKYWANDASSIIFKNNNLLLKQIDITRPLTR
uniref:CSON005514 protein n=1 Tax=Culicoides sonorensis TaxID=179676 RepID=A0A336MX64_CULSO